MSDEVEEEGNRGVVLAKKEKYTNSFSFPMTASMCARSFWPARRPFMASCRMQTSLHLFDLTVHKGGSRRQGNLRMLGSKGFQLHKALGGG